MSRAYPARRPPGSTSRLLAPSDASIKLLEKLGFKFEPMVSPPEGGPDIKLFAHHF